MLGSRPLAGAPLASIPSALGSTFPETTSASGYWRTDFTGSPWVGTPTLGNSGSEDLTEATNPPTVGSAVNGWDPAHFDGTNDRITGSALSQFFTTAAWEFVCYVKADSAVADPGAGSRFTAPCILCDTDAYLVLALTDSGLTLECADGVGAASTLTVAFLANGTWRKVVAGYDGTNLYLSVDEAAATTQAYAALGALTGSLRVGANYDASAVLDGDIAEVYVHDTNFSGGDLTSFYDYLDDRYVAAGTSSITGTWAGSSSWSGTLVGRTALTGAWSGLSSWSGTLAGRTALTGTWAGVSSWTGAASAIASLTGAWAGVSSWSGTLVGRTALTGTWAGVSSWTGTLAGRTALTGTWAGVSSWSGTASAIASLTGTWAGVSSWSGTLGALALVTGTWAGSSSWSGAINAVASLTGTWAGVSSWTGTLVGRTALTGAWAGSSSWSGTLAGRTALTGTWAGTSSWTGAIRAIAQLTGTWAGVSSWSGTIVSSFDDIVYRSTVTVSLRGPSNAAVDGRTLISQMTQLPSARAQDAVAGATIGLEADLPSSRNQNTRGKQ